MVLSLDFETIFLSKQKCSLQDTIFWAIAFIIAIICFLILLIRLINLGDFSNKLRERASHIDHINQLIIPEYFAQMFLTLMIVLRLQYVLFPLLVPILCYNGYRYFTNTYLLYPLKLFKEYQFHKNVGIAKLIIYILSTIYITIQGTLCFVKFLL
ncbi:protein cornichon [Anaeramoeba flamelloides]|uniref:Protein cornichon n=1 Tax=Anaeramoeba flamelloides TaxID=1746091 RepID=A0AAV7YCM7_9EUKA|nr:protein cornichon [Anaeramoeba flamelloides]